MRTLSFLFGTLGLGAAALVACSSTTTTPGVGPSSSSGTSGASSVPDAECKERCAAKLVTCQAPAQTASEGCASVCGGGLTESQLDCLETKSCEDLDKAETIGDLCPSSGSSGTSGTSGGPSKPTELSISARFGSAKAIHVLSSDQKQMASSISIAGKPSFSPSQPSELPDLFKAAFTVTSPPRNGCTAKIGWTLNSSELAATMTASETLPATACATFSDAIAQNGIKGTFDSAAYPNGGNAKVTVSLTP